MYNKEQTLLLRCPTGLTDSPTLPDSVTDIADDAFCYCQMQTVHLPTGLRTIGDSAFSCCTRLERIEVPNRVEYIGYAAFGECSALRYIHPPEDADICKEEYLFLNSYPRMEIDGRGGYFYGIQYDSW